MIEIKLSEIAAAVGGELYLPEGCVDKTVDSVSIDTRSMKPKDLFIALKGERFDGHDFIEKLPSSISGVVSEQKKEVDLPQILVESTYAALGKLGEYCRAVCAPKYCIGITGSVGKTTTKEMVADILGKAMKVHYSVGNFNNAIGLPLTLIGLSPDTDALICEMGMSGFGEISYLTKLCRPDIAVITNIGMSHIEMLGSREGIRNAKLEIIEGLPKGGTLILNGDEPLLRDDYVKERIKGYHVVYVGFARDNDVYPTDIYRGRNYLSFDIITSSGEERVTIPAIGDHFVRNALFACAVGKEVGATSEDIQRGFAVYEPQGLRQKIYERRGVVIIADCYNAGPESMSAALKVLGAQQGRRIAVLGDMMELGAMTQIAHKEVGREVLDTDVNILFTLGKHSTEIAAYALAHGFSGERCDCFDDKETLAEALKETVRPGDHVLFKASRKMKLEEVIALSDLEDQT